MKKLNEKGICYASGYLTIRSEELYHEGLMGDPDREAFIDEYKGKRKAIEDTKAWLFNHREGITDDSVDDYEAHMEHLTMMMKASSMFKDGYIEGFRSAARFLRWVIKAFGEDA